MTENQIAGIFGRMKQLLDAGELSIPIYETADDRRISRRLKVESLFRTEDGNFCANGLVVKRDELTGETETVHRTVRLDRIQQSNPNRDAKFFCLAENLKKRE